MKSIFSFLLLVLAVSCASGPTKEEKEAFTNKVDQEKLKTVKELAASSDSRIPLKAGQWVKIHTTLKEGNKDQSLSTFKVLKVDGKTVTMEVETTNASTLGLNVMQYEVENYPTHNKLDISKQELEKLVDKMNIKKITMKQGNEPAQELPVTYMPMAKGMLKDLFASGYRIGEPKKTACASEYLKAPTCVVFEYEANAFGFTTKGTSFAHSSVPVVGFIKSDSDKSETKVVNFGLTGAKSSL
ncbi:MAG TPA: hypothetical protein VNJ08_11825 [Bacteriovoracaceae bacterium]|nr:hypothetical protein [Bacteriovoracaceae bacterium]